MPSLPIVLISQDLRGLVACPLTTHILQTKEMISPKTGWQLSKWPRELAVGWGWG